MLYTLRIDPKIDPEDIEIIQALAVAHRNSGKRQTKTQATQTPAPLPPATTSEVATQTPRPPTRSYAEAATSTMPPPKAATTKKDKGKQPTAGPNAAPRQSPPPPETPPPTKTQQPEQIKPPWPP